MINALGLLEVRGLTASIAAADAMLKAAQVRILNSTVTPSAMVTLVIEGDLAACRAALDAGSAAASLLGQVIARKEIGRPENDTEWFVLQLTKANKSSNKNINSVKPTNVSSPKPETLKAHINTPENITKEAIVETKKTEQEQVQVDLTLNQQHASSDKVSMNNHTQEPMISATIESTTKPVFNETTLHAFIQAHIHGCNMTEIINHFKMPRLQVKSKLTQGISKGMLQKKGNRYISIMINQ